MDAWPCNHYYDSGVLSRVNKQWIHGHVIIIMIVVFYPDAWPCNHYYDSGVLSRVNKQWMHGHVIIITIVVFYAELISNGRMAM